MTDRRKLENAALALPIFGAVLIVPPLISIFNAPIMVAGVPLEVVYLFTVWFALIGSTAALSSRMKDAATVEPKEPPVNHETGGES